MTMIGIHVVGAFFPQFNPCPSVDVIALGLMMLFRIYALYQSRKRVIAIVVVILLVQASVNAWLLTKGERMIIPHVVNSRPKYLIFVVSTAVVHNPVSGVRG
jgi:hypothetical protein